MNNTTYSICYDCGYGERGISVQNISKDEMLIELTSMFGKEIADRWASSNNDYFEISPTHLVLGSSEFDEDEWESAGLDV